MNEGNFTIPGLLPHFSLRLINGPVMRICSWRLKSRLGRKVRLAGEDVLHLVSFPSEFDSSPLIRYHDCSICKVDWLFGVWQTTQVAHYRHQVVWSGSYGPWIRLDPSFQMETQWLKGSRKRLELQSPWFYLGLNPPIVLFFFVFLGLLHIIFNFLSFWLCKVVTATSIKCTTLRWLL